MSPSYPDEAAPGRSWGTTLAMAGAMVAGLAVGRSGRLVLVAGITAALALKRILREGAAARVEPVCPPATVKPRVPTESPAPEPADCCSGAEKSLEPDRFVLDAAAVDAPPVEQSNADVELPVIWEQGRGEPESWGALAAETVWLGLDEPTGPNFTARPTEPLAAETAPAVPALAPPNSAAFPESPSRLLPLDSGPAQPATNAVAPEPPPSGEEDALPFGVWQLLSGGENGLPAPGVLIQAANERTLEEQQRGAHHSVVPHAPVDGGRHGRRVMLATAAMLVIVAVAAVLGFFELDGWIDGLKQRWQVAHAPAREQTIQEVELGLEPPQEE